MNQDQLPVIRDLVQWSSPTVSGRSVSNQGVIVEAAQSESKGVRHICLQTRSNKLAMEYLVLKYTDTFCGPCCKNWQQKFKVISKLAEAVTVSQLNTDRLRFALKYLNFYRYVLLLLFISVTYTMLKWSGVSIEYW